MFQLRTESKGLELRVELGDVPQFISTDASKLRQIMINLLQNAIKFTETGHVTLRVDVAQSEGDREVIQHKLLVAVEDTGVGIANHELNLIFEAFAQATAGQLSTEGTGLGLTISHKYVELLGGEMQATSQLGKGSQFQFWIPIQLVSLTSIRPLLPNRPVIGLRPGQPRYRILVVDDQPTNRQLLVLLLQRLGLAVQEAANGTAALEQWRTWQPHLIWMDIRMAGMTGHQVMRRIRAEEWEGNQSATAPASGNPEARAEAVPPPRVPVPIIALTAQAYEEDRDRAIAAGFTDFLTKPFEVATIFQLLAVHLGLQYQYAETESSPITTGNFRPNPLTPADLQVMSDTWIAALHEAALNCSSQEVEALIAQIPAHQAVLAKRLKQLIHHYEFDVLMRLSQPNGC
ncbi:MAG: ATP-binding protein [Leptolyngbyaceae cyanobacterium bins.349]|nr:ATP-binding protein [Leptolyngbyaceae cyanobacterium bins.349]